jgi:hypothetical protein
MPFPPIPGMCIDGITVNDISLRLSMVAWHVNQDKFMVYTEGIDPEVLDRKVERIKRMFVGPWQWFECEPEPASPPAKAEPVAPVQPESKQSDVTKEIYKNIMKRRGGSLEELRGEPPPKEDPDDP